MPILQNPYHHLRHHLPKLMACMPRLLLAKATSLVVAGEALYLDFMDVEEASSPTLSVAEEGGVGSVAGDEDFSRLAWLLSGFHRVECMWGSSVGPL